MITNKIRYGGTLNIGDFIVIGCDWSVSYGWYCGNGKSGNIQFIAPHVVNYSSVAYDERVKSSTNLTAKDRKGFSLDHIGKSPIRNSRKKNVIKIIYPESIFTGVDLEMYKAAKDILTQIKFLKP